LGKDEASQIFEARSGSTMMDPAERETVCRLGIVVQGGEGEGVSDGGLYSFVFSMF